MTYFGTYGEVPGMGFRESVNALLDQVAYIGWDFGYLAPAWAEANYRALTDNYSQLLEMFEGKLRLVSHVSDSTNFAEMIEVLVAAANEGPIISDEHYCEVEYDRRLQCIADILIEDGEDRVTAEEVMRAACEVCDILPYEDGTGEYGFCWLKNYYRRALKAAIEAKGSAA